MPRAKREERDGTVSTGKPHGTGSVEQKRSRSRRGAGKQRAGSDQKRESLSRTARIPNACARNQKRANQAKRQLETETHEPN